MKKRQKINHKPLIQVTNNFNIENNLIKKESNGAVLFIALFFFRVRPLHPCTRILQAELQKSTASFTYDA